MTEDEMSDEYNEYAALEDCTCEHEPEDHEYPEGKCKIEGCPCEASWTYPNG